MPSQRVTPALTSSRGAARSGDGATITQAASNAPLADAPDLIFVAVIPQFQNSMPGQPLAHRNHIMRSWIFPMRVIHVIGLLLPHRAIGQGHGEHALTIETVSRQMN